VRRSAHNDALKQCAREGDEAPTRAAVWVTIEACLDVRFPS